MTHVQEIENAVCKNDTFPGSAQTLALPKQIFVAENLPAHSITIYHEPQGISDCRLPIANFMLVQFTVGYRLHLTAKTPRGQGAKERK
jgi:hypothetical protein